MFCSATVATVPVIDIIIITRFHHKCFPPFDSTFSFASVSKFLLPLVQDDCCILVAVDNVLLNHQHCFRLVWGMVEVGTG